MRPFRAALTALSLATASLFLSSPTAAHAAPPPQALLVGLTAPAVLAAPQVDYEFLHNLPLAHTWRGAVVADGAQLGFSRYARDMGTSWKKVTEDGRPAWLNDGVQANLWLPLDAAESKGELALEAVIKPIGKDQRLDVFIDDKKVASPNLTEGFQLIRVPVSAGQAKVGFVKVRLHFRRSTDYKGGKSAVAIRALRLGPSSLESLPVEEAALSALLAPTKNGALQLPANAGLDWYLTPVAGQRFVAQSTGTVKVLAQTDGDGVKTLGEGQGALNVDLAPVAGKAVRLMLRGGTEASLSGAKITGGALGQTAPKKPKYVVFWLIDTLRADKLSFYKTPNANKRPKVKTPHLEALAKEGVVFETFYVQGNESKASHASLFTGTYPVVHGVYTHEAKLHDKFTTIAEAFKASGYSTAGYCSNGYVSDRWNYIQGFDHFTNFIREGKANNAQAVTNAAIKHIDKHLEKQGDKPLYLYLGTSDPHVTYRAHKEFIDQYDKAGAYNGRYQKNLSGDELGKLKGQKSPPSLRDRQRIEALYENEIAFNDKHFGRLVDHLKKKGMYDDTLFIISSDHGDEFWEHGSCGHGHNVYQELVSVPLILRFPGGEFAGRVESGAEGIDLLPTLMSMLGSKIPDDVQGMSQLPYIGAKAAYPTAVMASQGAGSYTLAVGPAKVIMRSPSSIEAFDLGKDPAELKDVFGQNMVTTLTALDPLLTYLPRKKTWKKADWGAPNNLKTAIK